MFRLKPSVRTTQMWNLLEAVVGCWNVSCNYFVWNCEKSEMTLKNKLLVKNWLGNRKKIRFLFLRSTKITRYQICWIPTFKRLKSCKRTSFWKSFCLQKNPQSCLGARKTKNTYGKERADVNLASKNGATPLYLAATWERTECLIHLLDARAKVTQLQTSGVFSGVIELPIAGANSVPQKRLHRLHWLLPYFWGDQAWC